MSDTPRTDVVALDDVIVREGADRYAALLAHARYLERELNEYKRMLDEALDVVKRWQER